MILTISGNLGSGKSTVAKLLAKKMDYKHYSTGGYMREMAKKRNITLLELSKKAEHDFSIDKEIDDWQRKIGISEDNFVIDARLGFHFIPNSVKVFLKVDEKEGAKRIFNHRDRTNEANNDSLENTYNNIKTRRQSEHKRYISIYGIDQENYSNYDLIIDTTKISAEEVTDKIINFIQNSSKS